MNYFVINNKSNSHLNILVDKDTKKRVFTTATPLYLATNNYDIVENITARVMRMQSQEVFKSIQIIGREQNKALKKIAYQVFDTLGWDQHQFNIGFDYINGTFYERIPEDIKINYTNIIEEAFFTMIDRTSFYQFIRDFTEGNIKAKEHMTELLKDILYGIEFTEKMNAYYNSMYGVDEE
jgi:hypothetical protein